MSETFVDEDDGTDMASTSDSSVVLGEYRLVMRLGEGGFGTVYLAIHMPTLQKYAVKVISSSIIQVHNMAERVRREASIMQTIRHPHVVSLFQVLHLENSIIFVMEYAEGGELFDLLVERGHFSESTGRRYFQQLISAMYYCHSLNVAHGDLKVENLLLDEYLNLKVSDFNLAVQRSSDQREVLFHLATAGTLSYMCPELVLQDQKKYDPFSADMYAIGVCLYFMLVGSLPFDDVDEDAIEHKIISNRFNPNLVTSPGARELIVQLLARDPAQRATMKDVLHNSWFLTELDPDLFTPGDTSPLPSRSPVTASSFSNVLKAAFRAMDSSNRGFVSESQFRGLLAESPMRTSPPTQSPPSGTKQGDGTFPTTTAADADSSEIVQAFFPRGLHSMTFFDFVARWDQCDATKRAKLLELLPASPGHLRKRCSNVKGRSHELAQLAHLLRPAFDTLGGRNDTVTDEQVRRKFAKHNVQFTDEEFRTFFMEMTRDRSETEFTFGEFLDAVCEDDVLGKSVLGRRFAALLGLHPLLKSKECLDYVRRGFIVAGTPDSILAKIRESPYFIVLSAGQNVSPCTCGRRACLCFAISFSRCFVSPEKGCSKPATSVTSLPMLPAGSSLQMLEKPPALSNSPADPMSSPALEPESTSSKEKEPPTDLNLSPSLSVRRTSITPAACEFDIHFCTIAAVEGYVGVQFTRVTGTTLDYHEAVRIVARQLECERAQAQFDSAPRGESELM